MSRHQKNNKVTSALDLPYIEDTNVPLLPNTLDRSRRDHIETEEEISDRFRAVFGVNISSKPQQRIYCISPNIRSHITFQYGGEEQDCSAPSQEAALSLISNGNHDKVGTGEHISSFEYIASSYVEDGIAQDRMHQEVWKMLEQEDYVYSHEDDSTEDITVQSNNEHKYRYDLPKMPKIEPIFTFQEGPLKKGT